MGSDKVNRIVNQGFLINDTVKAISFNTRVGRFSYFLTCDLEWQLAKLNPLPSSDLSPRAYNFHAAVIATKKFSTSMTEINM